MMKRTPCKYMYTPKRSLVTSLAIGCIISLSGCQTIKSIETQFAGGTYKTIDGRLIDAAEDRIVEPVTENPFTMVLDQFDAESDGQEVGFNVSNRLERERADNLKALSKRELDLRELQFNSIQELSGEGAKALSDYLTAIVERLLVHWPHDKPEVSVVVLRDDTYSASMTPHGILRINTAVLLNANDEDEVAAVLAHELSHALLKHHNADNQQAIEDKSIIVASRIAAGWLGSNSDSASTQNTAIALAAAGQGLFKVNSSILHPGWKRHQEDEADLLAVDLLFLAGYDWERMTVVQQRLAVEEQNRERKKEKELRKFTEAQNSLNELSDLPDALSSTFSQMGRDFSSLFDGLDADHPPAIERLEETKYYLQREYYSEDLPPDPKVAEFEDAVWNGPGFSAIKKSVYGERAAVLAERGELQEARELALKSLDGRMDTDPVARHVLYLARKEEGQNDKALFNLERASEDPQAGMNIFQLLRDEYAEQERWDDALSTWHSAFLKFPEQITVSVYLPEKISLLARAGRTEEALENLQQCKSLEANFYLTTLCDEAAKPITSPSEQNEPSSTQQAGSHNATEQPNS